MLQIVDVTSYKSEIDRDCGWKCSVCVCVCVCARACVRAKKFLGMLVINHFRNIYYDVFYPIC
jgi:hypothetical protein